MSNGERLSGDGPRRVRDRGRSPASTDNDTRARTELTLESIGITLIGVVAGIGVTVAFGLSMLAWWWRVAAGGGSAIILLLLVKAATTEHGILRRLARWITSVDVK